MLDQNTTTLLTTFIVAGMPLVGVYLGFILNRWQESTRRKRETTKEMYELTLKVYRNLRDLTGQESFTTDLYETIAPSINRMIALANLHLRPVKTHVKGFVDSLDELQRLHEKCDTLCNSSDEVSAEQINEAFNQIRQGADICKNQYDKLKDELEKLVR